jgi:hypothetical protein
VIRVVARQSGAARVALVVAVAALVTGGTDAATFALRLGFQVPIPLATVVAPALAGMCLMTALPTATHHQAAVVRNVGAWNASLVSLGLGALLATYHVAISSQPHWGEVTAGRNLLVAFELTALLGLGLPSLAASVATLTWLIASVSLGNTSDGAQWWAVFAQSDGDAATLVAPVALAVPALLTVLCAERIRYPLGLRADSGYRLARGCAAAATAVVVLFAPLLWPGWVHYGQDRVERDARPAIVAIAGAMLHPSQSSFEPGNLSQVGFDDVVISESELSHLADVRHRIQAGRSIVVAALAAAIGWALAALRGAHDRRSAFASLLVWSGTATIGLGALLVAALGSGEVQFAATFHTLVFPEGNWTFGSGSVLAETFGSPGFLDPAARGLATWIVVAGAAMIASGLLVRTQVRRSGPVEGLRSADTRAASHPSASATD